MPAQSDRSYHVLFILLYMLTVDLCSGLELGIGAGIASYPGALDPHALLDQVPVIYPRAEFTVPVTQTWEVRCCAHRSVYAVNLQGCFCLQSLTTNSLSVGGALRLGRNGDFHVGLDGMYGFSTYDHGGVFVNSNTYGVKMHVSLQQPLWGDLSYVLRTGVQQERVASRDDLPGIDMTIFTVEFLMTLGL